MATFTTTRSLENLQYRIPLFLVYVLLFVIPIASGTEVVERSGSDYCTRSSLSICILSSSASRHFHLTSLLRNSIKRSCSPCTQYARMLRDCSRDSDGVIFFSPPHYPSYFHLNKDFIEKENKKVVGKVTYGYKHKHTGIPAGRDFRFGEYIHYRIERRRDVARLIPKIAKSYCAALSKIRKRPSPNPTPTSSPTPSVSPINVDFNDKRPPNFNLEILDLLFRLLLEDTLGEDFQVISQLVDLVPSPSASSSASHPPSPSPYYIPHPSPSMRPKYSPKYPWRQIIQLTGMPDHQNVVQVCTRANCAARVTVVSTKYIRWMIINNALNKIRTRPSFADVFSTDRRTYIVTRIGGRRFVVIIPFKASYLAEF